MKINITKKEYRLLLDMLYIADWVMHAHEVGPEKRCPEHRALRKNLLSYYKEMGVEELIEYSEDTNEYYELQEYDNQVQEEFIRPYDDEIFWDELIHRLSVRDVVNKHGVEAYNALGISERFIIVEKAKERYEKIFSEKGLDSINISHGNALLN